MSVNVSDIMSRVGILLQDTTNVRWTQAELLTWLNDAQREIIIYKPNAFIINGTVPLVAGAKQTLPAAGLALVSVNRNFDATGLIPGNAIRLVSKNILDSQIPNWSIQTPSATILHYIYTEADQRTYYVWPPAIAGNMVEMVYSAQSGDAVLGGTITMPDIYMIPIINYILYRAYGKDADFSKNDTLAAAYYTAFTSVLGGKTAGEQAFDPNKATAGNTAVI